MKLEERIRLIEVRWKELERTSEQGSSVRRLAAEFGTTQWMAGKLTSELA
jgi:hypothetical protein